MKALSLPVNSTTMQELFSYRPHNPGHDYYDPGVYLITLVTRDRSPLLAHLNGDPRHPATIASEVGCAVMEEWSKTPAIQAARGNKISILNQVCMPDHWHGVIQVHERMNRNLGHIIQYVKSACTARWRLITGTKLDPSSSQAIRGMSERQRAQYYSQRPREERPLFDDDYDDTICFPAEVDIAEHLRHRSAMLRYVDDNPRRAIIRRARPDFMRRCMHVVIDGRDYAAFGNMFLLRWARKEQVFCHRKARYGQLTPEERLKAGITYESLPETPTSVPYETTAAYKEECEAWLAKIMAGQTVIVTPGISKGESLMKDECLTHGYPLIHLQKEPIGKYWKPEAKRFNACTHGTLLILAPWKASPLGERGISDSDYAIFHNLNKLAEEICRFDGPARIVNEGTK